MFKGWAIGNKDYTSDTPVKTIADIRTSIKGMDTFEEGQSLNIYGMVFDTYRVTFLDETGAAVHTDTLQKPAYDSNNPEYEIKTEYTPHEQDEVFLGWKKISGSVTPEEDLYQINDKVTISGDVTFASEVPSGHWLSFDANGKGASYTAPSFLKSSDITVKPNDPTRDGYTFVDWYDNPNGEGSPFTFGQTITESTVLYAKWNANPRADYHVIIWKQNLAGDGYDFETSIKLSGNSNSTITTVVQIGSGNDAYARINNSNYKYLGFYLKDFDRNKTIAPEGTTIVNVRYDRKKITYNFRWNNGTLSSFSGLYGTEFTNWPNPGNNRVWKIGSGWNTVTFPLPVKVFDPEVVSKGNESTDITFTLTSMYADYTLTVYKQTEDGKWNYTDSKYLIATAPLEGDGWWTPTETYDGFTVDAYRIGERGNWVTNIDTDTDIRYGYNDLYLRYSRNKYNIVYMDGRYVDGNGVDQDENKQSEPFATENVYYEADISKKGDAHKPTKENYTFAGWYKDDTCTDKYEFTTMPSHNVTVYAKWIKNEYRVFVYPNVPEDETEYSWPAGQATSFKAKAGEKINNGQPFNPQAKKYELIGWYTDSACTQPYNFDAYTLNDTTVTESYDQTEPTKRDDRGNTIGTENEDAAANRFWITKKLELYARWRAVLDGAKGIDVVYDANGGSDEPTDSTKYLDQAKASAQAACKPPAGKVFSRWVLQRWDEESGEFVNTDTKILPGNTFTVLKKDARQVIEDTDAAGNVIKATYTIKLIAEYVDAEETKPTHIYFYANTVDNEGNPIPDVTEENQPKDEDTYKDIQINAAQKILSINQVVGDSKLYEGYEFLGWSKKASDTEPWLAVQANGKYTVKQDGKEYTDVEYIAADELQNEGSYDDLYAIWKPKTYTVIIKKTVDEDQYPDDTKFQFTVDSTAKCFAPKTFELVANGEPKKYESVPFGTTFSIAEADSEYFALDTVIAKQTTGINGEELEEPEVLSGDSYTVKGNIEITYKNKRKTADVEVKKVLEDHFVENPVNFDFTVSAKIGENTISLAEEDSSFTVESGGDGHKISGLPVGAELTITENAKTDATYSIKAEGLDGKLTDNKYVVSVPKDGGTVTFTNTREKAKLTVKKLVAGNMGDTSDTFKFTLTLTGQVIEKLDTPGLTPVETNKWTFELQHDQSIQITVPKGVNYTISESFVESIKGYKTTYGGDKEGTIDGDKTVVVTNTRHVVPAGLDIDSTPAKTALLALFAFAMMCVLGFSLKRRYVSRR